MDDLRLARQIDEYVRLGSQNFGLDRLDQEIYGTKFVRLEHFRIFVRVGADEDDRNSFRAAMVTKTPSEIEMEAMDLSR